MEKSDAMLVQEYLAGDRSAFEGLYRRHAPAVRRFAVQYAGDDDGADEILQETFIRAAGGLDSFRGQAEFRTWLFAVAHRAAADFGRGRRREARTESQGNPGGHPAGASGATGAAADPAVRVETRELIGELRQAIASLPDVERVCLVLCELQGFSLKEAAGTTGWSEAKVKVTLFRARRRLRELLGRYVEA